MNKLITTPNTQRTCHSHAVNKPPTRTHSKQPITTTAHREHTITTTTENFASLPTYIVSHQFKHNEQATTLTETQQNSHHQYTANSPTPNTTHLTNSTHPIHQANKLVHHKCDGSTPSPPPPGRFKLQMVVGPFVV
jgi:hypothetical protein